MAKGAQEPYRSGCDAGVCLEVELLAPGNGSADGWKGLYQCSFHAGGPLEVALLAPESEMAKVGDRTAFVNASVCILILKASLNGHGRRGGMKIPTTPQP